MSLGLHLRRVLLPLVPAYRLAHWMRSRRVGTRKYPVRRLRFPVVSIGNLSTGGAGKTPVTIALAKALTEAGLQVDVLSRGYGRKGDIPARVSASGTAESFGDEPILIGQQADVAVYVAAQRFDAGRLAEGDAATIAALGGVPKPLIHLLDDGFQHRQLARNVDILLLDRHDWREWLLPAGNLREPLSAARRAGVIAIPAGDPEFEAELKAWGWSGPIWRLRRKMEVPTVAGPVAAFCGIARPGQFFSGLKAAGLQLASRNVFPDHHAFTAKDIDRLVTMAHKTKVTTLITTEKDRIRMGELASGFSDSLALKTAGLRIEIEDEREAIAWLLAQLKINPPAPS